MDPILKDVLESERAFISNPQLFREYEAREKAAKDELSLIKSAEIRGERRNNEAVIKKALDLHLDYDTIMKLTSCSLDDIKKIENN